MEIKGKNALITGAAKRVGRAIALRLASEGVNILLHYYSSEKEAKETQAEIESKGVFCHLYRAELTHTVEVMKMAHRAVERFGVDILVNSASQFFKTPLGRSGENDWNRLLDANLKAPFLLSNEIGPWMTAHRGGAIVNIADWSGFKPYEGYSAYCASKGGLITLTKSLARELAPKVRANAVSPGPVLRPSDMSEAEAEAIAKLTALGRWGSPEDIARAVQFLVESDYINGTVLTVDGGRSLF